MSANSLKRETDWICVVFNLQVLLSFFCSLKFIIYDAYISTTLFSIVLILLATTGITAGAHRLWAHRSYEATNPLKVFLMLCQTLAGMGSIYDWVRYHRLHHKHFGTELDPYNPSKGFIYSFIIANNLKLSEAQEKALDEEIDMSDLEQDKIVMFQKKYYWLLFIIITLLLPINAPAEYWGETIVNSCFIAGWFRYEIIKIIVLLIYSATTIWDLNNDNIKDAFNSNSIFFINKSHWLSYHYLSPWDYQVSEFGKYGTDCTTKFIRVCAALDLANNLKVTTSETVREALNMAIDQNRTVGECLVELQKAKEESYDNIVRPSKYIG